MRKTYGSANKCEGCHKRDSTVAFRNCGYIEEIYNRILTELICDACEHEHLMDI